MLLESSRHFGGPSRHRSWRTIDSGKDGLTRLVINGHPDPRPERFCAALCAAFLDGARTNGRQANALALGAFANGHEGNAGQMSPETMRAIDLVRRSAHLTVVFPLWLDLPPPLLTGFFEQVVRHDAQDRRRGPERRFAHIVVTMAMPAFAYRSVLRARTGPCRSPNLLSLPGIEGGDLDLIGSVDTISRAQREGWLMALRGLGAHAP
mgnify:FL=1